jgi:hypothetical protein
VQSNIRELGKLRPEKYKKDSGLKEFERGLAKRPQGDLWMDPGMRPARGARHHAQ